MVNEDNLRQQLNEIRRSAQEGRAPRGQFYHTKEGLSYRGQLDPRRSQTYKELTKIREKIIAEKTPKQEPQIKSSRELRSERYNEYRNKKLLENEKKRFKQEFSTKRPKWQKKGYGAGIGKGALGLFNALAQPEEVQGSSGGMSSGRGRGRPNQSFTPKMLPDGTVVRMPVQAYKRAVTMQKAQMRMQRELALARASSMPPPDHVRGGYPDEMDRFLDQDSVADQMAQQDMMQQQMMQQNPQQPMPQQGRRFTAASIMNGARNLMAPPQQQGITLMGSMQQRPMQPSYPGQRNPALMDLWGNSGPKILNQRNIFNNPRPDRRMPLV